MPSLHRYGRLHGATLGLLHGQLSRQIVHPACSYNLLRTVSRAPTPSHSSEESDHPLVNTPWLSEPSRACKMQAPVGSEHVCAHTPLSNPIASVH
jgi:hypothetical protein